MDQSWFPKVEESKVHSFFWFEVFGMVIVLYFLQTICKWVNDTMKSFISMYFTFYDFNIWRKSITLILSCADIWPFFNISQQWLELHLSSMFYSRPRDSDMVIFMSFLHQWIFVWFFLLLLNLRYLDLLKKILLFSLSLLFRLNNFETI